MAGAYYIWILGAFAVGCGGILLLLTLGLLLAHYLEKKKTGATHGFLELPTELRKGPSSEAPPAPSEEAPPPDKAV